MENTSLNNRFSSHHWFIGEEMTVQQFLDYVLEHEGDFVATMSRAGILQGLRVPMLSDSRYSRRMTCEEAQYLAAHSEYFASRWAALFNN